MSGLLLGGVTLDGLEVPGGLRFGGRQALAVHRLAGGGRVVDVLGPDDADVTWTGIISGPDAAARAQALDAMRSVGAAVPLAWDDFFYTVIIRRLSMSFANPWWIPYAIACTVVFDPSQLAGVPGIRSVDTVLADLTAAGGYLNVQSAVTAASQPGALTSGTAAFAAASAALVQTGAEIAGQIASSGATLGSNDLATAVRSAGTLAALTSAQGYVMRASANLQLAAS